MLYKQRTILMLLKFVILNASTPFATVSKSVTLNSFVVILGASYVYCSVITVKHKLLFFNLADKLSNSEILRYDV